MKKDIKKLLWSAVVSFVVGVVIALGIDYLWQIPPDIKIIIKMLFGGYLATSIVILIQLYKLLNYQLDSKLHDVPTMIKNEARIFGEEILEEIATTLKTLFTGNEENILWEFKNLNFDDFEQGCLNCENGDKPHTSCIDIINLVKKQRRHRMSRIANCLIFDKGQFFAIESIIKPSEMTEIDADYYKKQKKILKEHNIEKAYRFLVITKAHLKEEILSNSSKFETFVTNNINDKDGTPLTLKIITYRDDIKDVFTIGDRILISEFTDFVLTKEINKLFKNKVTVFAQNKGGKLAFYDSNRSKTKRYNKWINAVWNKEEITENVSFSENITSFGQITKFNDAVQSKT